MLWTIASLLLLLWVIGVVTATTLGGFVHLLVAAAVVVLSLRLLEDLGGPRPRPRHDHRPQ